MLILNINLFLAKEAYFYCLFRISGNDDGLRKQHLRNPLLAKMAQLLFPIILLKFKSMKLARGKNNLRKRIVETRTAL